MANEATVPVREAEATVPVERVSRSRVGDQDLAQLGFGRVFADHMFLAEYEQGRWSPGRILPYGPLPLPPSITGLQYALAVFEGMKAHRAPDGSLLLFRPRDNARRLQRSAARLAMPPVPETLFLGGLRQLLREDREWAPPHGVGALYIRPVQFSNDPAIGVRPAERFLFSIFTSPFAKYYAAPVDVMVSDRYARAFPGGTGDVKPAGNYAGAMLADREAKEQGCQSVLWLDAGERRYVEECGVMNVFAVFRDRILTPPLTGTILPGITRDSVIALARKVGIPVEEKALPREALYLADELFFTGTAAEITPIRSVDRQTVGRGRRGPVTQALQGAFFDVIEGRADDEHGWLTFVPAHAAAAKGGSR